MDTGLILNTIETNLLAEHFNKPDRTLKNLRLAVIKKVKATTKQQ